MNSPQNAAQNMASQDAAVYARLAHNSVLTYCWGILNGHRAWCDLKAPTTAELMASRNRLEQNKQEFGQQYLSVIQEVLKERTVHVGQRLNRLAEMDA